MNSVRVGIQAFREDAFSDGGRANNSLRSWASYQSRLQRYQVYWGLYESSLYRDRFLAPGLKADWGLYHSIRPISNVAYRLIEFWSANLLGGAIDPEGIEGALPIVDAKAVVRKAIVKLWRDSNFTTQKSIWSRNGSAMGDAPLELIIDEDRGRVHLCPRDPRTISEYTLDRRGNVTSFEIQEERPDPSRPGEFARYTEQVSKVDQNTILYRTLRNEQPYDWGNGAAEWTVPLPFVPLVWCQHIDVGKWAGWSEMHATRSKLIEVDEQGSVLSDYVRKSVNTGWAVTGSNGVGDTVDVGQAEKDDKDRDESAFIYFREKDAKVQPLIASLDIPGALEHSKNLLMQIESDFPELALDRLRSGGQVSGEALRIARQPTTVRVQERRANYDNALVRANMMALTIGGVLGFPGYESFNEGSYANGSLDHAIGDRPVFSVDEQDNIALEQSRSALLQSLVGAGLPLPLAMEKAGYSPEDIALTVAHQATQPEPNEDEEDDDPTAA